MTTQLQTVLERDLLPWAFSIEHDLVVVYLPWLVGFCKFRLRLHGFSRVQVAYRRPS